MSTATLPRTFPAWLRLKRIVTSRYFREPMIIAAAYALYYLARHAADDARPAFDNARYLMDFEANLGILSEVSWQSATISYSLAVHLFNIIYFYGHFPLIATVGIFLFVKNPKVYTITRNAMLMSGAVALVLFALYPVAPPRMIMGGIVDTLAQTVPLKYDDSPYVNQFAAMPSMHVGWMLLISLGLFLAIGSRLRYCALILPPAMFVATIVTGNHYFIDGIAGLLLCSVAFCIALWLYNRWPAIESRGRAAARSLWSAVVTP